MTIDSFLLAFIDFINAVLVPLLFSIALLIFIWNVIRYFIIDINDVSGKEKARSYALYSILAFVLMVGIWGIVNLLVAGIGVGRSAWICPDYLMGHCISRSVQIDENHVPIGPSDSDYESPYPTPPPEPAPPPPCIPSNPNFPHCLPPIPSPIPEVDEAGDAPYIDPDTGPDTTEDPMADPFEYGEGPIEEGDYEPRSPNIGTPAPDEPEVCIGPFGPCDPDTTPRISLDTVPLRTDPGEIACTADQALLVESGDYYASETECVDNDEAYESILLSHENTSFNLLPLGSEHPELGIMWDYDFAQQQFNGLSINNVIGYLEYDSDSLQGDMFEIRCVENGQQNILQCLGDTLRNDCSSQGGTLASVARESSNMERIHLAYYCIEADAAAE